MTTATATSLRVPVRTWQEKAILAAVFCEPLAGKWEAFDGHVGFIHDHLYSPASTDDLIDQYFNRRPQIDNIERLLRSLRDITPGPDVTLEIPAEFPLLRGLDAEIEQLVTTDVEELLKGPDVHPLWAQGEQARSAITIRCRERRWCVMATQELRALFTGDVEELRNVLRDQSPDKANEIWIAAIEVRDEYRLAELEDRVGMRKGGA